MGRSLDFMIIGVQKGGTTSLWRYLRSHPQVCMPNIKEMPIFCLDPSRAPAALEALWELADDDDGPERRRFGKAATRYMMGMDPVTVEVIAERIARAFPEVRLIALLRDPIERAMSQYRMLVRRGVERRCFDDVVSELLEPDQLKLGRRAPTESNAYIVQGEYARILRAYRDRFPAEQIHVESSADLDRNPGAVLDRVLSFLDVVGGHRPNDLGVRHHAGGIRPRLDPEGEAQLRAYMEEQVWQKFGDRAHLMRLEFNSFMNLWNIIPDSERPSLSQQNRERLEGHYRADAGPLSRYGVGTPWLTAWDHLDHLGHAR